MGSGVGPADADVVEASLVAQGDGAGCADDVGADPVVGVCVAVVLAGGCFGPGVAGDGGVHRCGRERCGRFSGDPVGAGDLISAFPQLRG